MLLVGGTAVQKSSPVSLSEMFAVFSGSIVLDGREFQGHPLGFGVQGHNCGYRHRNFWTWAHAYFPHGERVTSFEALMYEMPFGLTFRRAVLWHEGEERVFRKFRNVFQDSKELQWRFHATSKDGTQVEVSFDGRGASTHHLPYIKTDCSGAFEVTNNSLSSATIKLRRRDGPTEVLETQDGAVLETV